MLVVHFACEINARYFLGNQIDRYRSVVPSVLCAYRGIWIGCLNPCISTVL